MVTWLSILSGIARAIGLFSWADSLWQKHKLQEARDAANKVAAMGDTAVTDKLRQWTKPD